MTSTAQGDVVDMLYRATMSPRLVQVPPLRNAGGRDVKVSPLVGLWWPKDPDAFLTATRRSGIGRS